MDIIIFQARFYEINLLQGDTVPLKLYSDFEGMTPEGWQTHKPLLRLCEA